MAVKVTQYDGLIGPDTKAMMNADTTTTSTPSTSTGSYNLGTAILKNGSRGDAVKELQRFLNDKLDLGLVVDGMLGPNTITVIKEWQKSQGLDPDGLIGPNTKAMMNAEAN
ncbi:peptidoglycan-binding protein [Candidatus Nomurabacteria bacterium]|nr:peptidoglycan-binding protein [Candidatus Nomurabacteria bacterium]